MSGQNGGEGRQKIVLVIGENNTVKTNSNKFLIFRLANQKQVAQRTLQISKQLVNEYLQPNAV